MARRALLLGFYSIGGQVLLLRELVASLNGDELFISTALFGWLAAVAVGAYLGGRQRSGPHWLFLPAAILLPIMILATRFSPSLTGHMVGEAIPFAAAALISIAAMLPVGLISGWLFPAITRQHMETQTSIVRVYLVEGIGAFVGGAAIVYLVGEWLSGLQMALVISILMVAVEYVPYGRSGIHKLRRILITLIVLPSTIFLATYLETYLTDLQYRPFSVLDSFDTHYGRQTILGQAGQQVLLSDNNFEAVSADLNTAENLLIPGLLYHPSATRVLYIGRLEYGVAELAAKLPGLSLVGLDPRPGLLASYGDTVAQPAIEFDMVMSDPVTFFASPESRRSRPSDVIGFAVDFQSAYRRSGATGTGGRSEEFDIIVLNAGDLGSYKASRLITATFLENAKQACSGVFILLTRYDTDSHISAEKQRPLATIYRLLRASFAHVDVWPGATTLFIASDVVPVEMLPYDTIITRLDSLEYESHFVSADYLPDRLSSFKRQRLLAAVGGTAGENSLDRPELIHQHLLYRSDVRSVDRHLLSFIAYESTWTVLIAAVIILSFLVVSLLGKPRRFGLFLFFTAGAASLSLELIMFYTFQSLAGALYSQMAMLIGAFMLGLAVGTFLSSLIKGRFCGYAALVIMLILSVALRVTWESWALDAEYANRLFLAHLIFLFVVAAATGALFVAATRHYYGGETKANRGIGYAYEIAGSSVAALFTTAVLLPVIGLNWLLTGIAVLIALALAGFIVRR
ncbi:MAG: hypothetical protein JSW34_13005 [Candidatus Zixiibacteriota bacterium]|nr:MAG: hypothetical protein JSW34_13005 [candidate division Zixibacteria bacterium]